MQGFLRQSTAATVPLGPFVDKTDAVSEETGLAGTMAPKLSKNGATSVARNSTGSIVHDTGQSGYYGVPVDATDTGTLGRLRITAHDNATHLPVWADFMVIPALVYDSLVAGSDNLEVDLLQINGRTGLWGKVWSTVFAAIAAVLYGRRAGADHKDPAGTETIVSTTIASADRTAVTVNDPA